MEGVRSYFRLVWDRIAGERLKKDTQDAIRKGTDPKDAERNVGRIKGALEGLKGTVLKLAGALGVAFGLAQAVRFFRTIRSDGEAAMATLARATGKVGDELKALKRDVDAVWGTVPEGVRTIAEVAGELNTRLSLTGPRLQRLTKEVLDFARVTDQEAGPAAARLGKLINAIGADASEAPVIMDKLALAAQESGASVAGLIDNILEAGPAFEELGFGLDRSIALFAQMERYGARPAEMISSLSRAMRSMIEKGATDPAEAFQALLDEIRKAPTALRAAELGFEYFGRAGDKLAEDIRAGRFETEELERALAEAAGTVARTADASATGAEKVAVAMEALRKRLAPVVDAFYGGLVPGVEFATRNMDELVAAVWALVYAMGAAGALLVLNRFRLAVLAASAATITFRTTLQSLYVIMGPKGWLILGVGALATAFQRAGAAARQAARDAAEAKAELEAALAGMDRAQLETRLESNRAALRAIDAEVDSKRQEVERLNARIAEMEHSREREYLRGDVRNLETQIARLEDRRREVMADHRLALAARNNLPEADGTSPTGTPPSGTPPAPAATRTQKERDDEVRHLQEIREFRQLNGKEVARVLELERETAAALEAQNLALEEEIRLRRRLADLSDLTTPEMTPAGGETPEVFAPDWRTELEELAEAYRTQWSSIEGAAVTAALNVSDAWGSAFRLLMEEGATVGAALESIMRGTAAAGISGFSQYAAQKVAENVALGFEEKANAAAATAKAMFPGPLAPMHAANAAQHLAASKAAFVSAGKWAAAGGGAAAAGGAVGAGGRAGGYRGGGHYDPMGGRYGEMKPPPAIVYVNFFDENNPRHQDQLGRAVKGLAARDSSFEVRPWDGRTRHHG